MVTHLMRILVTAPSFNSKKPLLVTRNDCFLDILCLIVLCVIKTHQPLYFIYFLQVPFNPFRSWLIASLSSSPLPSRIILKQPRPFCLDLHHFLRILPQIFRFPSCCTVDNSCHIKRIPFCPQPFANEPFYSACITYSESKPKFNPFFVQRPRSIASWKLALDTHPLIPFHITVLRTILYHLCRVCVCVSLPSEDV